MTTVNRADEVREGQGLASTDDEPDWVGLLGTAGPGRDDAYTACTS
jgi:hypothetical protein